jgi:hypothetical protein
MAYVLMSPVVVYPCVTARLSRRAGPPARQAAPEFPEPRHPAAATVVHPARKGPPQDAAGHRARRRGPTRQEPGNEAEILHEQSPETREHTLHVECLRGGVVEVPSHVARRRRLTRVTHLHACASYRSAQVMPVSSDTPAHRHAGDMQVMRVIPVSVQPSASTPEGVTT